MNFSGLLSILSARRTLAVETLLKAILCIADLKPHTTDSCISCQLEQIVYGSSKNLNWREGGVQVRQGLNNEQLEGLVIEKLDMT